MDERINEMNRFLSYKQMDAKNESIIKNTYYCKCSHPVIISNKNGVAECSHCHNLVFKDRETEFKYRMKQNYIKERRNNK